MSYTVATPGGKARPGTVTAASSLLFLCAAVELIIVVVSILVVSPSLSVLTDEFASDPNAEAVRTFVIIGAVIGCVIAALFATGMVVLGLLVRKGKNPARIVTWVLAGIAVLCYGCSLGSSALTSSLSGIGNSTPETEAMQKRLEDAVPAWQGAVSTTASIVTMLALVAVIILLAMPASNEFFRKEQEVWVPPTWPGDGSGGVAPAQAGPPAIPPATAPQPFYPPAAPPMPPAETPTTPPSSAAPTPPMDPPVAP